MSDIAPDDPLDDATLLVEVGEVSDAEREVARVLDERPEDLRALDLLGKIKHIRGELSAAVACWAQFQTRSPQSGAANMRLSSLLALARDPERGAGEFLAVGRDQLWRKPAAHLELEEVFRLFVSRKPEDAKAACDRLASKYRGSDAELYKMAILAKAWVAELSGDLAESCAILENLGTERGFESDVDRALALSRIYERIGTPEHLEKAVNICRYLETVYAKITIFGRLTLLLQALGRADEAAAAEERFLEIFLSRMHRPSLREVVRSAAARYVPIEKLQTVRSLHDSRLDHAAPRERAIALALIGRLEEAAELFRGLGTALDRKYLAEIAALQGDERGAAELFLGTTREDPGDLRVLGWLLDHASGAGAAAIQRHFSDPKRAEDAKQALRSALQEHPLRAAFWRHRSSLANLLGDADEAGRCAAKAAALSEAAERKRSAVGRVLAASVYHFVGHSKGLIHEVWATRKPADPGRGGFLEEVLGNLTPEMAQAVRNTFLSVREYAQAKLPQQTADLLHYNYTYKVTKEDEPSGGLSAGLPTALAFLSVFLHRPVAQDLASSGVLIADAHDVEVVRPVGEPEYKVRGAVNRNLRMLILPEGNRPQLERSPLVPAAVCREVVRYVSDLDQAVGIVFGEDVWLQ